MWDDSHPRPSTRVRSTTLPDLVCGFRSPLWQLEDLLQVIMLSSHPLFESATLRLPRGGAGQSRSCSSDLVLGESDQGRVQQQQQQQQQHCYL